VLSHYTEELMLAIVEMVRQLAKKSKALQERQIVNLSGACLKVLIPRVSEILYPLNPYPMNIGFVQLAGSASVAVSANVWP
jgi:hypothetical protein